MSDSEVLALDVRAERLRNLAVPFVFLFAAIGLLAFLPQVMSGIRARAWPTVSGRIITQTVSSELMYVIVHKSSNSNVNESRVRVRYSYSVGGTPYVGANISDVRPFVHNSESERSRLAVGQAVVVHYDPASPDSAVIDAGPPFDSVLWSALSVAGLLWAMRHSHRKRRRATHRQAEA